MKDKILIFGGTTEAGVLMARLREAGIYHKVSVATEYGAELLEEMPQEDIIVGRKTAEEMESLIRNEGFAIVVDATHPFAVEASSEIKKACSNTSADYLRLSRNTSLTEGDSTSGFYVNNLEEAIAELKKTDGNILLLTGSRDLDRITEALPGIIPRLYVRVLPDEEIIHKCKSLGLKGRQIIAMQGPFSRRMNAALIKETGAACILTKESGAAGGFFEKLEAADECNIKAIVLKNPELIDGENTYDTECVFNKITKLTGVGHITPKRITLAGMGPGDERYFTLGLKQAIDGADIIFGAESVINRQTVRNILMVPEYKGDRIYEYLELHPDYHNPLVLFSGDISLCSGAKGVSAFFEKRGYKLTLISGISSVSLFANRLGISLENTKILNAHGKHCNVRGYAAITEELVILPSDTSDALRICKELSAISDKIIIGYELGTNEEKLFEYSSNGSCPKELSGRCLIYAHNGYAPGRPVSFGIRDKDMIRAATPMTKEEIRALLLKKLALTPNAVFYDIGAGTGSVSIEAALTHPTIKVFAIEKNDEAVLLIKQNKDKFYADNMEIIRGEAPYALSGLPAPTHVFIGGSGGNTMDIIRRVLDKNDSVRIVLNTLTPETFAGIISGMDELSDINPDILQVWVSRYKKTGRYHMPDTLNPVYIITLKREPRDG